MTKAQFRFSTQILRRLGEELNPSPDQSIMELVKNAYDADARTCKIQLQDTDKPGGSIHISDTGDGMDASALANNWLTIGSSSKSPKRRTRLGRVPAGSKGLGRLAALRMGSSVLVKTRPRHDSKSQYELYIDWQKFDRVSKVDEVDLTITQTTSSPKSKPGTDLIIENLKTTIGRMDVKRLARSLILLSDPFGDDPDGFKPTLSAPEFDDLEKLVKTKYFDDADYHLTATLDDNGRSSATVVDWQGKELFSAKHQDIAPDKDKRYSSPPASFELWVFVLNSISFSNKLATLSEVRSWLEAFGGVHLYENGLRVSPYGNPGNDWLDINLRRAQSPEERPSTNTVIGRVNILDTEEPLVQKTDRSGFIESEAFHGLRAFAQDALEWLSRRRMELALQRRAQDRTSSHKRTRKSKKSVEQAIEGLPPRAQEEVKQAFETYDKSRDSEVKELRKEVQLYRTLSTAGITAATFAHESNGNPIKVITHSIKAIERRGQKSLKQRYDETLKPPVDSIIKAADSLAVLGTATLKLLEHGKRRLGRIEIHATINEVVSTFQPFLKGRDVAVETELCEGSPYLRGSAAAVESIFTNLLNNSLAAFERSHATDRKVIIRTSLEGNVLTTRVIDNGPGIENISARDIWLPGQTTQPNGTGLGLTIVHDTVKDLGGNVDVVEKNPEYGGAEIIIDLPIIGA